MESLAYKYILSISGYFFANFNNAFVLLLVFRMDDLEYIATLYHAAFCFHSPNQQN